MNRYSYQGFQRIKVLFFQVGGVIGIIISTFATIFILAGIWAVPRPNTPTPILDDPRITIICFAVWFLVVGWSVSLTFFNFFPTIWTDEDEIQISAFLLFRIRVPWSSIIDIGFGSPPKGYVLIRARRITLSHRAYGWLYSRTLYPSFLIERGISDRDKLIEEISQRVKKNSSQEKI